MKHSLIVPVCAFAVGVLITGSSVAGSAASLSIATQGLTSYRTCIVTATPSTTTSVSDAAVRQASATTNFGSSTTFEVASGSGVNRRSYLRFLLTGCNPAIPPSATVRSATLRLYASSLPAVCATIDIFRVTTSWTEAGLTWNNQPFGTTLNYPSSPSRSDSFGVGTPSGCDNRSTGYVTNADVTADVAAFVAGSVANNGWMLRDDTEGATSTRSVTFSAKNLGTLAQAPQLIVTWVTAP